MMCLYCVTCVVENIVPSENRRVNTSSDNVHTRSYSMYPNNISVVVASVLDPPVLHCPTTGKLIVYNAIISAYEKDQATS